MNVPFYIARRYLFSKKSHNAINLISGVSVCGISLATLALVCTLSVINGFQDMVADLFTVFDPELKITALDGKTFDTSDSRIRLLQQQPEIDVFCVTLEDYALLKYKNQQVMGIVKGVQDNFEQLAAIDSVLYGEGDFILHDEVADYGILGAELMTLLGSGIQPVDPIQAYAPRRGARIQLSNPTASLRSGQLFSPGVIFAVSQQKYDANYVLTSLDFARRLFGYTTEASAIELRLKPGVSIKQARQRMQDLLGPRFQVSDRYEQQADVFRVMKIEKFISYLFLTFILLIASFNLVGSMSMLILDKQADVGTLRSLGASDRLIVRIFLCEGFLISALGAVLGVGTGLLLCFLQQRFGFITLGSADGHFIIDAYPVSVHAADVVLIAATVLLVGLMAVWYPVRYFSRRLLRR